MAGPTNKDSTGDETVQMLKIVLKSIQGTIDFSRVATKLGAPNAEAARKRVKRFFEKDEEPLLITGSTIGASDTNAKQTKKTTTTAANPSTAQSAKVKPTPAKSLNGNDGDEEDGDNDVLAATSPKTNKRKAKAAAGPRKKKATVKELVKVEETGEVEED